MTGPRTSTSLIIITKIHHLWLDCLWFFYKELIVYQYLLIKKTFPGPLGYILLTIKPAAGLNRARKGPVIKEILHLPLDC